MNKNLSIFNIFILFSMIIPVLLLFFFNNKVETLILPYCFALFVTFIISTLIVILTKNKFYAKIYIITTFFHFLVGIFIQILKYDILTLPTINGFAWIGIDNDGWLYHSQALELLNHSNDDVLFYSYIVFYIYKMFGINEFTACIVNCMLSGFIPVFTYILAKNIGLNKFNSKILTYIIAFSLTISAYTTVLMRDVYIILLSLLIIFFYSKFAEKFKIKYLFITILFFILLCLFRAYAAGAVLCACIIAHFIKLAIFKIKKNLVYINKFTCLLFIFTFVILVVCITFNSYLKLDYIISLFDMNTILQVSEIGYGGANSSFGVDRVALSHFLPLFLLFGYFCMFFAPFPHQWFLAHNIVQAFSIPETIFLYIIIFPSFFLGSIKGFKERNFIIMASFLYIIFVFTFYGMILDNSGAVFRGRAPFIPLLFLISFYCPASLLKVILEKCKNYANMTKYRNNKKRIRDVNEAKLYKENI